METSVERSTRAPAAAKHRAASNRVFAALIVLAALLSGLATTLPQGEAFDIMTAGYEMPADPWVIAIVQGLFVLLFYGALGALGIFLARRLGLPDLIDPAVPDRWRFLIPALAGAAIGLLLIAGDRIFAPINGVGVLPHPPFPTSLVASFLAGVNEELIFRLFFVSFWTWVVARLILRGRGQDAVFWVVAVISALAFAAGHLPTAMILTGAQTMNDLPPVLIAELVLLNGGLGLVAAYFFKRAGYLAAAGVHFWADIVWHVVYGFLV